jgi:hypothetical protein
MDSLGKTDGRVGSVIGRVSVKVVEHCKYLDKPSGSLG